jgi:hypothetical protein
LSGYLIEENRDGGGNNEDCIDGSDPSADGKPRPFSWVFVGNSDKSSRKMMMEGLSVPKLDPYRVHDTSLKDTKSLSASETRFLMEKATFCPSPAGWVSPDCFRLGEAFEAGCIPVPEGSRGLHRAYFSRYYRKWAPIFFAELAPSERLKLLTFEDVTFIKLWRWSSTGSRLANILHDEAYQVSKMKRDGSRWWCGVKEGLARHVRRKFCELVRKDASFCINVHQMDSFLVSRCEKKLMKTD